MSSTINNIDPSLTDILKNVKDKNTSDILNEKHTYEATFNKTEKMRCPIAVKFQTIKSAYTALTEKDREVYIIREKEGEKMRERAYTRCSRKCYESQDKCWKHWNASKSNKSNVKYWNDIVSSPFSVKATPKSLFFTKKGKKLTNNNNSKVPSEVMEVVNNKELCSKLIDYAKSLLNEKNKKPTVSINFVQDNNSEEEEEEEEIVQKNPISLISEKKVIEINDNEEENEQTDSSEESSSDGESESIEEEEEEEQIDNNSSSEEEEEVECIKIETKDGREL